MTALGIRYLTGCCFASDLADPRSPEWPPHPGRVFMALAATHFETRGDEQERQALEWLEQAGVPAVSASDAFPRSFAETYVPVNDKHGGITWRGRQPRSFPAARPHEDSVYLVWDAEIPQTLRLALEDLCRKVTRIGHSASLVQMWVVGEPGTIRLNWLPRDATASYHMRVAEAGTLQYLRTSFNQEAIERYFDLTEAADAAKGKEKARLKKQLAESFPEGQPAARPPRLTRWQGYATADEVEPSPLVHPGPFDPDLIVLTKSDQEKIDSPRKNAQRRMGLEATLQLTSALRDAAMKAAGNSAPEWLSGHQPDGKPTTKPHAAFFPLPFVGAKHADGHILGLAIAIPRTLETEGNRHDTIRTAIGALLFDEAGKERTIRLWRGNVWKWSLSREKREYPPLTLRSATWTGPDTEWASVTPIVLHHYPKRNRENDVERILLEAFASAGLPEPAELRAQPVSLVTGAGHARSMPQFTEGGENLCRYQVHVVVKFPCPVRGPVLVGRGRFCGYGLLRPLGVKP